MKKRIKLLNNTIWGKIFLFPFFFSYHRFFLLKNRIIPGYFYSYLYYYNGRIYRNNDLTIGIKKLGKQNTMFPHPVGIVIGKYVQIGKNCSIYQNVTIGVKAPKDAEQKKYPKIGNNVYIGANSLIIGNIRIGDNVVVGAGTLVNKDVPDNAIVYGNPMKIKEQ